MVELSKIFGAYQIQNEDYTLTIFFYVSIVDVYPS